MNGPAGLSKAGHPCWVAWPLQSRKELFVRERKKSARYVTLARFRHCRVITPDVVIHCLSADSRETCTEGVLVVGRLLAFLKTARRLSYTRSAGWLTSL